MAICDLCNREMTMAATCSVDELHRGGVGVAVFRYAEDPGWTPANGRCPDCGVLPGGFHHLGCDIQHCPACRRQLISCDCGWDELGSGDDEDAIVLQLPAPRPPPVRTPARPPFAAVVAPLRARHHDALRRLAQWSLAQGRSCDLDIAALCLDALDAHRSSDGSVLLDRPTVQHLLSVDVWNLSQVLGTSLPERWHVELWTILGWLDAEELLHPESAPLAVLREPLRCYGCLDETGHPLPPGTATDVACQCYVPYDASLPPGVGRHIVGHDPDTFEALLTPARLRTRGATPCPADLEPIRLFARRLRRGRSGAAIHVEQFFHVGVVPADERTPALWLYRLDGDRSGHDALVLDAAGGAWLPRPDKRFRLGYRWVPASDTVAALRAAGLAHTAGGD